MVGSDGHLSYGSTLLTHRSCTDHNVAGFHYDMYERNEVQNCSALATQADRLTGQPA